MSLMLMERGFRLLSGGTDNHLMMIDLRDTEITGKLAEETLDAARITVNKNTVPFEPRSPFVTSGIRLGTPVVTTRGMRESEMTVVADLIARALAKVGDAAGLRAQTIRLVRITRYGQRGPGSDKAPIDRFNVWSSAHSHG